MLEIKKSTIHGKGVFAKKFIRSGTIIECDVLILEKEAMKENEIFNKVLKDYVFPWDKKNFSLCIGFGSFLNHSPNPNLKYKCFDKENLKNVFIATDNIFQGQELFITYSHMHSINQ